MTKRQPLIWRILFFAGFVFLQNLSTLALMADQLLNTNLSQGAFALIIVVVFLAVMMYFIRVYQRQIQEYNPRGFGRELAMKGKIKWILLTVAAVYLFLILVTPLMPGEADNQKNIDQLFRVHVLGITLYGAILGPIIEELLYRGILMNYFWNENDRKHDILAVVTSGLIFGLLHEPAISLYLLVYSVIGIFFGILYLKTKDIRCNMIAHILYNSITFIVMFTAL